MNTIEQLREVIDIYDLTPNPAKGGQFLWEFESMAPYPNQQALASIIHAHVHVGNMIARIVSDKWDMATETIPEVFCLARRFERALGCVTNNNDIDMLVSQGIVVDRDVLPALFTTATTSVREAIIHDSMHVLQANPGAVLKIDPELGVGTCAQLWAIGIELSANQPHEYDIVKAMKQRLNSLAMRFSEGQIRELYSD